MSTHELKQFFGGWGSLINGLLILAVGAAVLWADARYTPREEMETQTKHIQRSIEQFHAEIRLQRRDDIAMVERQIRDMQRGMAARQQEHVDLHRLVIRLETIVDRMESPPDRR